MNNRTFTVRPGIGATLNVPYANRLPTPAPAKSTTTTVVTPSTLQPISDPRNIVINPNQNNTPPISVVVTTPKGNTVTVNPDGTITRDNSGSNSADTTKYLIWGCIAAAGLYVANKNGMFKTSKSKRRR